VYCRLLVHVLRSWCIRENELTKDFSFSVDLQERKSLNECYNVMISNKILNLGRNYHGVSSGFFGTLSGASTTSSMGLSP